MRSGRREDVAQPGLEAVGVDLPELPAGGDLGLAEQGATEGCGQVLGRGAHPVQPGEHQARQSGLAGRPEADRPDADLVPGALPAADLRRPGREPEAPAGPVGVRAELLEAALEAAPPST